MNPIDTLKQALDAVVAEEKRLLAELAKLQVVRNALEAGLQAKAGDAPTRPKAAPGGLRTAILGVLPVHGPKVKPMGNAEIRAALAKDGYPYSLTPLHLSKTLTKLYDAKKVQRFGFRGTARYTRIHK